MKKILFISLFVLILLGFIAFMKLKSIGQKITVSTPVLLDVDLSQAFQKKAQINITLSLTVTNNSTLTLPVSNITADVWYNGQSVGRAVYAGTVNIKPNASTTIEFPASIYLKPQLIGLITDIAKKNSPAITYKIEGSVYGFNQEFKDKLNIKT